MTTTSTVVLNAQSLNHFSKHPIEFIESCLFNPETGQPFELLPAERAFLEHAFQIGPDGKLIYNGVALLVSQKVGKTTFEALVIITTILLYRRHFPKAHSRQRAGARSESRVFEIIDRIIRHHRCSGRSQDHANKITFPASMPSSQALPCDAGSAAGSNQY